MRQGKDMKNISDLFQNVIENTILFGHGWWV